MKSLTNLRKGLALVLCAAMLMGDTTMLQAAQVEATTVGTVVSESKAETEVAEDVPAEVTEQEEAEVVEPQAEATEVSEAEEKSEETQVEAADVETALENKALEATYTATVGETTVTVVAPEGAFTEEVTLQVTEVEITDEMQAQLDEQAIAEQKAINSASAYDISFVNAEGKEVEPAKEVQVSIATAEVNSGDDASVYHFDEEKAAVADMEATVVESGDVAFETDHFSTYVIVNKGQNTVTVKIHHVDQAGNEIYSMDERKIAVGARVVDFNKAANWEVSTINRDSVNGNQISAETLANGITTNMEIWVHYTPKNQEFIGDVTAWDYVVQPNQINGFRSYKYSLKGYHNNNLKYNYYSQNRITSSPSQINGTWYYISDEEELFETDYNTLRDRIRRDSGKLNGSAEEAIASAAIAGDKLSINTISNYTSQSGYNRNRASLTVGKTDQNYEENKHNDSYTSGKHKNQKINDYGSGDNAVKYGIVKGVDNDGEVIFNVNQPGIFSTAPSVGKTVYNNKEFSLKFRQTGDTYELAAVKNNTTGKETSAGSDFFIMQDMPSYVHDGANSGGQNDFFGMRYDVQFTIGDYVGDLKYRFSGDDDMWVILDGNKVVIDLGGIHQAQTQEVDLWQYIDGGKNNCDRTKEHKLTILYMERGAVASNCEMKFTLPNAQVVDYTTPLANLDITKVDEADNTPLAGATFKLQYGDASIERTVTTGEDGKVHFGDLIEGTYTLTETAAPGDYELPTENWIVKVIVSADQKTATATLYKADGKTRVENNIITNKKHEEPVVPTYDKKKTVKVTDYDKREYEITLDAKSTTTTTSTPSKKDVVDVVMVLDISGSMATTDVSTSVNDYVYKGTYRRVSDWQWRLDGTYYVKISNRYYLLTEYWDDDYEYYGYTYTYNGTEYELDEYDYVYQYEQTTKIITRLEALKNSAGQFLTSISEKSPNSNVGIISFDGKTNNIYEMQRIGSDPSTAIAGINAMSTNKGITSTDKAMTAAKNMLSTVSNNGHKKVVILFTDGEPTDTSGKYSSKVAGDAATVATSIKGKQSKDATIFTVGFALTEKNAKWLRESIASSSDCAFTTDTQDGLTLVFEGISQSITKNYDIENATITDVIDARFELADGEKERLEKLGAEVNGNVVTWTGQTIPYKENWTNTIKIKAKPDFLGGNKIPTNVAPDSGISIGEGGIVDPFDQPTVNVKLLNLTGAAGEKTVFLGDSIDASDVDKTLAKAIKANGTVLLQNPTFDAQGQITVDYIYPGTTDKVGTITFTKKAEGEGAAFTKHNAEYIGSPAELYTVTAAYKPLAPSERPKDLTATAADGGAVVTTSATATATHKVNVVAGTVTIQKKIAKSDYKKELGDPIFTFKLKNTKTDKVYYKTLRFKEVKEGLFNETLEATIEGLPKGTYTVEELDTMGFTFKSLNVDGYNKKEEGKVGTFTLELNHDKATATYANKLTHSPRDTDTDVVKNSFKLNGKTSSTKDADNGNTADVGKHTTLKITNEGGNQ